MAPGAETHELDLPSPPLLPPLEDCGYRLESEVRERHGAPSRRSGRLLAASLGCDVAGQSWRENVCVCVEEKVSAPPPPAEACERRSINHTRPEYISKHSARGVKVKITSRSVKNRTQ